MNRRKQLAQLAGLADLILDVRLNELHAAARCRDGSLAQLAALNKVPADDLSPVIAAQADLAYQRWADIRRAEINLTLARQTAEWIEAQASARHAFGQQQSLTRLQTKLQAKR